jgi:hypothetical protein
VTWWSLIFGPLPEVAHVGPGDDLAAAIREPEGGGVHVRVVVRVPQAIT